MSAQEKFHDRLGQIVDCHTTWGTWWAIWPVKTTSGWTWLRYVHWEKRLLFQDGPKHRMDFVTTYYLRLAHRHARESCVTVGAIVPPDRRPDSMPKIEQIESGDSRVEDGGKEFVILSDREALYHIRHIYDLDLYDTGDEVQSLARSLTRLLAPFV